MSIVRLDARKEHKFTHHYRQPEAYHFCQDSVVLAEFVASELKASRKDYRNANFLDLCAGCGVVGLELAANLPELRNLEFLEIQDEFIPYLVDNKNLAGLPQAKIHNASYSVLLDEEFANRYDFILANPPYFMRGEGALSGIALRDRARFFIDSDFGTLLRSVSNTLKPGGCAYILVKSGEKHGRDIIRTAQLELMGAAQFEFVANIRGTLVLRILKRL